MASSAEEASCPSHGPVSSGACLLHARLNEAFQEGREEADKAPEEARRARELRERLRCDSNSTRGDSITKHQVCQANEQQTTSNGPRRRLRGPPVLTLRTDSGEAMDSYRRLATRVLVFVILVPSLLLNSATTCSCHRFVNTPTTDGIYDRPVPPSQAVLTRQLPSFASAMQGPSPDQTNEQLDQTDWAQRLSEPSEWLPESQQQQRQHPQAIQQSSWPATGTNQIMTTKPTGQNHTLLGNILSQALLSHHQQQSPLSRAIEATKMFVRQQQQQIAAATSAAAAAAAATATLPSQQSSKSHLPFVVGDETAHQQAQMLMSSGAGSGATAVPALPPTTTTSTTTGQVGSKLYNFLFQPKSQLSQSLAEIKRKMIYQNNGSEPINTAGHEPFQLASSEGHFQHLSGSRGRSIVTLSAPYEQGPRSSALVMPKRPAKSLANQGLLSQASGHQLATMNATDTEIANSDDSQPKWHVSDNSGNSMEAPEGEHQANGSAGDEQQQQQLVQAADEQPEGGNEGLGHHEQQAEQDGGQQEDHDAALQWSGANQMGEEQPEERVELQRHQPQELAEAQIHEGQQQDQEQQQVYLMSEGGDVYEQPNDSSTSNQTEIDTGSQTMAQRLSNSTMAYLVPHSQAQNNETLASNQDDQDQLGASQLQGDESLHAIQLPSQYESIIRVPPEGHYDDYFKPMEGSLNGQATTNSLQMGDSDQSMQDQRNSTLSSMQHHHEQQQQQALDRQQQVRQQQQYKPSDYTFQYYMNQQPLRHDSMGERTVEFVAQNRSTATGNTVADQADQVRANEHFHKLKPNDSSNGSYYQTVEGSSSNHNATSSAHQPSGGGSLEQYQIVINQKDHQLGGARLVAQGNSSSSNEDSIQLIVANSNDQLQDPNTNEKVITYTSEGGNQNSLARLIGKPARQTFFNKDLNESPPPPPPSSPQSPPPTASRATSAMRLRQTELASARVRSTRSPLIGGGERERLVEIPNAPEVTETATLSNERRGDEYVEDVFTLLEPARDEDHQGQFGRYASAALVADGSSNGRGARGGNSTTSGNQTQAGRLVKGPQKHSFNDANRKSVSSSTSSRNIDRMHRHQPVQTIRRPQVTEAKFELKDLPLNAPTAMPSAAKSISELPVKAKRLRDHQVDKNELMSELLTALDRVKAAIYKLQPLTAKMNAIYRKSVTSNTRDQILDNNKGTYAKRYPPGDYDDSYDRMHPSELLERQRGAAWSSRASSSSASNTTNGTKDKGDPSELRTIIVSGQEQPDGGVNDEGEDPEIIQARGSRARAVYLPAPRQMLEDLMRGSKNGTLSKQLAVSRLTNATRNWTELGDGGLVKRMGSARTPFSPTSKDQILYDDEDEHDQLDQAMGPQSGNSTLTNHQLSRRQGDLASYELIGSDQSAPTGNSTGWRLETDDDKDERSPLFGYRITIYQSPSGPEVDQNSAAESSRERQILSYSLVDDGHGEPVEFSSVDTNLGRELSSMPIEEQLDSMATSESSLVPMNQEESGQDDDQVAEPSGEEEADGQDPEAGSLLGSESGKMHEFSSKKKKGHKKMMEKKGEEEKKGAKKKAKGQKEGEKHFKHQAKGKKGQEEHKKKKEFKKIKHHKGLMSKESHKLHRDKHIKAHDRGAAKEKALKERTQIEFFEREQIVDDEFEKGKKSTMKAGWASGHDLKKTSNEMGKPKHHHGHDSMSMGGSHQVNQLMEPGSTESSQPAASASSLAPMMMDSAASEQHASGHHHAKGKGHSMETSSGKQSNKYEKKHMEAKGKKFKGWREKGYKIITETEFIDRGSLHDSAYKKRDKGAAHHQKFKKHESKSEGHQGTMHEHHKKSHKKEEKKSKSEEKKKELSGKEEGGKEAKKSHKSKKKKEGEELEKKKKKKKHFDDHDQEESAPSMAASLSGGRLPLAGLPMMSHNKTFMSDQHDQRRYRAMQLASLSNATNNYVSERYPAPSPSTLRPNVHPPASTLTLAPALIGTRSNQTTTARPPNGLSRANEATVYPRQYLPTITATTTTTTTTTKPAAAIGSLDQRYKRNDRHQPSLPLASRTAVPRASGHLLEGDQQTHKPTGSAFNATLLDIIDRLNISRSDKGALEYRNMSSPGLNSTSDRRNQLISLSPLVRLVNNLARMNQTQANTRRQPVATSEQNPTKAQTLVMRKVQFDEPTPTSSRPTSSEPPVHNKQQQFVQSGPTGGGGGGVLQSSREMYSLARPSSMAQADFGQQQYGLERARLMEPDRLSARAFPLHLASPRVSTGDSFMPQLGGGGQLEAQQLFGDQNKQQYQQYYMPIEQQADQQQQQQQRQHLAYNGPDPNFSFLEQPMIDYDSLPLASGQDYQQLLGSSLAQPALALQPHQIQRLQQFSFLTD